MYSYNYIIFYRDNKFPKPNPDGYQTLSLKELEGVEGVFLIPYPLHHLPYFFRFLYFLISRNRLKKIMPPIIIKLFYPYFFEKKHLLNKPICFLMIGGGKFRHSYLDYLKKTYPDCKIVGFYRDLLRVCKKNCPEFVHNKNVDIEMSFDNGEAKRYGMAFCPEYSSMIDLSDHNKYPLCDVFFCGQAKDRHETLLKYYQYLTKKGLKCHFFITMVPEEEQIVADGLFYNCFLPYKEMLCRSFNAKCLLDINQKDACGGYTSRFYEAIMYNRKLISDNPITKESSFYNENDIAYVNKPEDITEDYLKNLNSHVDYHYNGEFSPLRMIETVEKLLKKNNSTV